MLRSKGHETQASRTTEQNAVSKRNPNLNYILITGVGWRGGMPKPWSQGKWVAHAHYPSSRQTDLGQIVAIWSQFP